MIAVLAPGQGAQRPGMLAPWLADPEIRESLERAGRAAGFDLVAAGTEGDARQVRDTAVAQPLIVALGVAVAARLGLIGAPGLVVAGHSIGEVTAAAVAGVLTPDEAVAFAARRGAAMAVACELAPTGMAALIGDGVEAAIRDLPRTGLQLANHNGAGQVVVAGRLSALTSLRTAPPEGVRVLPLEVAGAFHTQHMACAEAELRAHARDVGARDAVSTLLSNADGAPVTDGAEVLGRLVGQVTSTVRWDRCMDTCRALGVTTLVELPPAGVLTGLAKRQVRGARTVAVSAPADLDAVRDLVTPAL